MVQYHTKRYLGGRSDDAASIQYDKLRHGMTPYGMTPCDMARYGMIGGITWARAEATPVPHGMKNTVWYVRHGTASCEALPEREKL